MSYMWKEKLDEEGEVMNKKQFIETYCHNCGTQRCEGIDTEWFEGCPKRWNLDNYGDAAAEIEKLNNKIMDLANELIKSNATTEKPAIGGLMGWICPVCGRGLSPYTDSCPCALNHNITYGTGTTVPLSGTITCQDAPTANFKPPREDKYNV